VKEYKIEATKERGVYAVSDESNTEKIDYTTSEMMDAIGFELKQAKKEADTPTENKNLAFSVDYDEEGSNFALNIEGAGSYKYKSINKLKRKVKKELKSLDGGQKGDLPWKILVLLVAYIILGLSLYFIMVSDNPDAEPSVLGTIIVSAIIMCSFCLFFAITSSFYNRKFNILPITIIKRKKNVHRSEMQTAFDFLLFTSTTVAVSELVKKIIGAVSDVQKFNESMPRIMLALGIILLLIVYHINALCDFLRTIARFVKTAKES